MKLWGYQAEVGRAIVESVLSRDGRVITVEIARQGGKNEISAHIELLLLVLFSPYGGNIIKASPSFDPQGLISVRRLEERLGEYGFSGFYRRGRNFIGLGDARVYFLSADRDSKVMGMTADILLEVDEAQDVIKEKFWREFRPMGASRNATCVLYGTPWDGDSLLEEVKEMNIKLERKDGIRRHFSYSWEEVSKFNPAYRRYVEAERERLGEEHPLFKTQYCLEPVRSGKLFSERALLLMEGDFGRLSSPLGGVYIGGLDVAGEGYSRTVLTIGELDFSDASPVYREPSIRVVEHVSWEGVPVSELVPELCEVIKLWGLKRVCVDSTGIGEGVYSMLRRALGRVIKPFKFTQRSKSELGFKLLSAVNSGRLKVYRDESSYDLRNFWEEVRRARSVYKPGRVMDFGVFDGRDDYVMSLALLVEASEFKERVAEGRGRDGLGALGVQGRGM